MSHDQTSADLLKENDKLREALHKANVRSAELLYESLCRRNLLDEAFRVLESNGLMSGMTLEFRDERGKAMTRNVKKAAATAEKWKG